MTGRRTGSRAAFGLSVAPVSALMLACTVADEGGATADQWIAAPAAPEAASRSPSVPPSTAGAAIDGQDPIDGRAIHSVLPDVDLSNRIVPLTELMSGGAGAYSGVPSIHDPEFVSAEEATRWIRPREPVLVTFCPLCYTAIAFEQGVDGEMRDFGVSGLPRASDLALYEYQTTTLWQQLDLPRSDGHPR